MRKKLLTAFVLAVAALGMTACYGGNQAGPKVAVNGDSITYLATSAIQNTLGANYAWNVDAHSGDRFVDRVAGLESQINDPQGPPKDIIINLGTNDVFQYNAWGDQWQAGLNQIADVAGFSGACVIFVNVSRYAADYSDSNNSTAEQINLAINRLVAQDPNFHLLDWDGFIHQGTNFEQYIATAGAFGYDVHPNQAGQQALANLYLQALQQDCS